MSKWIPLATPVVYIAATICYMVYKVAGAQAVDQVGGVRAVDHVAGAQVLDQVT